MANTVTCSFYVFSSKGTLKYSNSNHTYYLGMVDYLSCKTEKNNCKFVSLKSSQCKQDFSTAECDKCHANGLFIETLCVFIMIASCGQFAIDIVVIILAVTAKLLRREPSYPAQIVRFC